MQNRDFPGSRLGRAFVSRALSGVLLAVPLVWPAVAAAAITLGSSPNPSSYGGSVTFTATVTGNMPTGTVTFNESPGTVAGCSMPVTLDGSGQAQCTTTTMSAGVHTITATYSGDGNNTGETSDPLMQTVNGLATTTALTSSINPSITGQEVTFTAMVSGGSSPTGTVSFLDGATPLGCSPAPLTMGQAECVTTTLSHGSRSITASYSGDSVNASSTSSVLTQVVRNSFSWDGSSSNLWSVAANWTPPGVPVAGDILNFPGGAINRGNNTNDLAPGLSFETITLTAGAGYNLSGASIGVNNLLSCGSTFNNNQITLGVTLAASATLENCKMNGAVTFSGIATATGTRFDAGSVSTSGATVTIGGDTRITAALSGSSTLQRNATTGVDLTLASMHPFTGTFNVPGDRITLADAALGAASVQQSGWIRGKGTIGGSVTTDMVDAGASPGVINAGALSFGPVSMNKLRFHFTGGTAGTGYFPVQATGVTLQSGAALELVANNSLVPALGQEFVLISNTGANPVIGTFGGLPQGADVMVNGYQYKLSYIGGDGNDVSIKAATTIAVTLNSSVNPSTFSRSVTLIATITGDAPTGTVDFREGVNSIAGCSMVAVSGNKATCTLNSFSIGSHALTAIYSGDSTYPQTPSPTFNLVVNRPAVATGSGHTCALTDTGADLCWGQNAFGQIGDGTTDNRVTRTGVSGLGTDVAAIAAGDAHSCALMNTGGLKCWGDNFFGQLGDGTPTTERLTPVDVSGRTTGMAAISAGSIHTCALTTAGAAECWGDNAFGQLGYSTMSGKSESPGAVGGLTSGITAISAGGTHTCALTSTGGVKCWGSDSNGQLGNDPGFIDQPAPVDVSGLLSGATGIATGYAHSCALDVAGGVKCWGSNANGQLGDASTTDRPTPVDVSGLSSGVEMIAAGTGSHTCALTSTGGVKCWGNNNAGQLGDGTTAQRNTPVDVLGINNLAISISAGTAHTCALLASGGVKCWGSGLFGQIGDGSSGLAAFRFQPVFVSELNVLGNPTLSSNIPASAFGQSVTFTATVTVGVSPTGTFNFKDGANSIAGCEAVALSAGQAQCATAALSVGNHTITAVYSGDANNPGVTSNGITQSVGLTATTTTLAASPMTSSSFGQSVTFTATITGQSPTGTVHFKDGGMTIAGCGTASVNGSAQAQCVTTALSRASHTITAEYSGDANNAASTSAGLSYTVVKASSSIALGSLQNPSQFGQSVTFTATVTGQTPGGTVEFREDMTIITGCATQPISMGQAQCTVSNFAIGSHNINATYSGDDNNEASSTPSALVQVVTAASSGTSLQSSANTTEIGQSVTFTAMVTGQNPSGTVQFRDGMTAIVGCESALLSSGQAQCITTALGLGMHTITAVYSGDSNNVTSTSAGLGHTVTQRTSGTALSSSLNPSELGQTVTFTAVVTGFSPTGTVAFFNGANGIAGCGMVVLSGGQAQCMTAALGLGMHSITATYGGDTNNTGGTSNAVTQTVGIATSQTTLGSTVNPSVFGQSVTFTATVSGQSPTGTVTFKDGGNAFATCTSVALLSGAAECTLSSLSVGTHTITAEYSGDASNSASNSAPLSQDVNQATAGTSLGSSKNPSAFNETVTLTALVTGQMPTGAIAFRNGGVDIAGCGMVALNGSGQAQCAISTLPVGSHNITAVYSGDVNNVGSTSNTIVQAVTTAPTMTALQSSLNPSQFAQLVTFIATLTGQSPMGSVAFKDGANTIAGCGSVTLSGGQAQCATSTLSVATHPITAVYSGDANNATSTSGTVNQVVNPAATTTAVSALPSPSAFGQSVTFTAAITGQSPTGSVQFKDGANVIGGCGMQTVSSGQATCTTSTLAVGGHSITATYGGDTNNATSTSPATSHNVTTAPTTVGLGSSVNPSTFNASVTFTATVAGQSPTGTLDFRDNGVTIAGCGAVALSGGQAQCATSTLSVGAHPITAVYSGDGNNATSTSPTLTQTVQTATAGTQLGSSLNPSQFSQSVTFTATVTGQGPTGTVNFRDGANTIAGCGSVMLSSGQATCTTSTLSVGTHPITAVYSGDGNNATSTSSVLNQVVDKFAATTALGSTPNPSEFGQSVTFTATITGQSPTGTVQFKDGANTISGCGSVNVVSAQAQCSTSTLSVGAHNITAVYSGDGNNAGSTSGTVIQNNGKATSSSAVVPSANPSLFAQSVTFTATVTGQSPTGTVTFRDGVAVIGGCNVVALNNGSAQCMTSTLSVGPHAITVVYSGDGNNAASTSPMLTQNVGKATTTTSLFSSTNPSSFGQSVSFIASVSGQGATGTVAFKDGANTIPGCGSVAVSGGSAQCASSTLSIGAHTITATYSGDSNNAASTSSAVMQTVNAATAGTTLVSSVNPSTFGQPVTFVATVTGQSPTGTVDFKDGATTIAGCSAVALGGGSAQCTTSSLAGGSHGITAVYSGDANNAPSTSTTLNQQVNVASSGLTVTATGPIHKGQASTINVSVTDPNGTPTGTVAITGAGAGCNIALSGGAGTCLLMPTTIGVAQTITANYSGDGSYGPRTSTTTLTVKPTMDIDVNGASNALTDGLLLLRRLFNLSGNNLVNNAIGPGAQRTDPVTIANYIAEISATFDIDGNGNTDALTDGLLVIRYLFGLRNDALINNAVSPSATRKTAPVIEAYIDGLIR